MKANKEVKISFWAHHLTTIVSVSLVLMLMGIIALIWIGADTETRRLKERIELSVIMADSISDAQTSELYARIVAQPYARNVKLISKEQALANWTADTGEDLQEMFGVNPLSGEISFGINADYASAKNLNAIKKSLSACPGVESVSSPDGAMIESMNRNIGRLSLILAVVAAVMLIISFVLINNTVHLTIYSRRFTIHTMQLVGATNGFIRRPVILNNMLAGLLAGLVAAVFIAAAIAGSGESGLPDLSAYVSWPVYGCVAGGLIVAGVLLCAFAALMSANRYLRKDYGQLFR